MGYKLLGHDLGPMSKPMRLVMHLLAWWMVGDIVLDVFTTLRYKEECEAGTLPCWYWMAGLLFLILPTAVMTLVMIFGCGLPVVKDLDWCQKIVVGPCYMVSAPPIAIFFTCWALCGFTEDEEGEKDQTAYLKLWEVVCEALPQVGRLLGPSVGLYCSTLIGYTSA